MVDKWLFLRNPRRTVLLVAILVVILVSSIYAYYWSVSPKEGPRVSVLSPPLELWLQLDKTTYVQGENISVSVGVKNTSNETITVTWTSYSLYDGKRALLDFIVSDDNGTDVFQLCGLLLGSTVSRTLSPEEELTFSFEWNMKMNKNVATYDVLPKGSYCGKTSTRYMKLNDSSHLTLETQTISFKIE